MQHTHPIETNLKKAFTARQSTVLSKVIAESQNELVKAGDFNELKGIVKELAEAQKRTEHRMEELAQAQNRTENRVEELVEAQKRTEGELHLLARELRETRTELKNEINNLRSDVGGLSRSMSYAFENEAYRLLPAMLEERYGISIKEKIVRADIGDREINIFARAEKEGRKVLIIGEAKLRLDERRGKKGEDRDIFEDLADKAKGAIKEYGKAEVVKLLITHYATKGFLKKAKERGIIIIQSFEW